MQTNSDGITAKYVEMATRSNRFDPDLYQKYDVKRGLRNEDGTGVLVGLTGVGDVQGYVMRDGRKVPAEGHLYYRGIDVRDIVAGCQAEGRFGFDETCFLLLFGHLPTAAELAEFSRSLGERRGLPPGFFEDMILKAPSSNVMNKLARCVLASYSYDADPEDQSVKNVLRQSMELIARVPTMVAYAYQVMRHYYHGESLHIHSPSATLSSAENFLAMMRSDSKYTHLEAELLDLALILHAEHGGGNNSTFTIRVISSAATDTYSAVAAAVGSLKGSKHGGANNEVMDMMDGIKAAIKDWEDEDEILRYLKKIIRREEGDGSGLIYGMGHAIYTLSDPRKILLKEKAELLAGEKGMCGEFKLYDAIERLAPRAFHEERGLDKPLSANVDFYSGFVYSMLNIPRELFTPIFAISRVTGWAAHRIEEIVSGGRIIRPAYRNVFDTSSYVPMGERG